ncbi:hypothetical protein Angca_007602 [Angiostrongylus cantonensis]|nr:hypothetical protein Angca_007602 [Angiostrongylus cantonensis]
MPVEQDIIGKWSFLSSENFEAYLKEVGVGMLTRKLASALKPTLEFAREGDQLRMTSTSTFKTYVLKFKIGETSDEKTMDGRDVSQLYKIENDRLVLHEESKGGGTDSRTERYIQDGQLRIVCVNLQDCECNGVMSKRVYERMKE